MLNGAMKTHFMIHRFMTAAKACDMGWMDSVVADTMLKFRRGMP